MPSSAASPRQRSASPPPERDEPRRLATVLLVTLALLTSARLPAQDTTPGFDAADRSAVVAVIRAQMEAFRADDAERAFSYASPDIRALYGDAETFLRAVASGYRPVYRPQAVLFEDVISIDGQPAQRVLVQSQEGETLLAIYPMQRQPDGSWRIDGCILLATDARML